ncbi:hypothetical protein BKCO1_3000050 [Neofusicoccum parvum]|uniref:Uncharacterized protein n=3 Tax=Neofusicoccum TaxID=407951 RepID=R1EYZ9_BOTPV|nr:hypothetical protein UCRNP2_201 [Neofusicoccum parvum UCRNP2]GME25969.1 hypothetical protein BKCO1_3000050 [Neofusicoccum parvum]GME54958.1 hypothetical protein BKCO1_3000050 [Neofusicoccum parvum]
MNTIRSTAYGWGILIVAGGGAYYFAKKEINAERAEKAAADRRKREMQQRLEAQAFSNGGANPSHEASQDPAPTRHAPATEGQQVLEKSKYEASEPFRSRKGDRFS